MERSGEWFRFSPDQYARINKLYTDMRWDNVDFSYVLYVAAAPYGGPIAVIKSGAASGSLAIHIYGAGGSSIRQFVCPSESGGTVLAAGWSNEEALVVLTSKYVCTVYELSALSNFGAGSASNTVVPSPPATSIKMLPQGSATSISPKLSAVKGSGLYSVDTSNILRFVQFEEKKDARLVTYDASGSLGAEALTAMEIISPDMVEEAETIVFVAKQNASGRVKTGSVVCINMSTESCTDLKLKLSSQVINMALNFNASALALYTESGHIYIVSSNFQDLSFSIDLGVYQCTPYSFLWCGSNFVLITFTLADFDECASSTQLFSVLISVHKSSETKFERISFEDGCGKYILTPEVDGVRIVTETSHYFLEDVDIVLVNLCKLKSTSPAALLAVAQTQYANGEVNGLLTVRNLVKQLGDNFSDVIDELLDAAQMEFDPAHQERILTVAAFGNTFCASHDAEKIGGVMMRLRILNALREAGTGVGISFRQYETLSASDRLRTAQTSEAQVIVDRLVNRRFFSVALDVCQLLKMKPHKVLVQWSCMHVQSKNLSDDKVRGDISRVLSQYPGASYIDASLSAFRGGREQLAIHLLNDDPKSQSKVFLLLQMRQDELALRKAIESDEVDLIHFVLLKMIKVTDGPPAQQLLNSLANHPVAHDVLCLCSVLLSGWKDTCRVLLTDLRQEYRHGMLRLERKLLGDTALDADTSPPPPMVFSMDDDFSSSPNGERGSYGGNGSDDDEIEEVDDVEANEGAKEETKKKKKKGLFGGMTDMIASALTIGKKDKSDKPSKTTPSKNNNGSFTINPDDPSSGPPSEKIVFPQKRIIYGTELFTVDDCITISGALGHSNPKGEADAKHLRTHLDLLEEQRKLASQTGDNAFFNQSVVKTLEMCFLHDLEVRADQLRTKYNVSEKKFWFLKIRALCAAAKWDALDRFGGGGTCKKLKSPIGFLPFVEELAKYLRNDQASVFVAKLPELPSRVEWYVKLDCFQKAADDAYNESDADMLQQILKKSSNPSTIQYIQQKLKALE